MRRSLSHTKRFAARLASLLTAFSVGVTLSALPSYFDRPTLPPAAPQGASGGGARDGAAGGSAPRLEKIFEPLVVSSDRLLLVGRGGLYMFDARARLVWQWPAEGREGGRPEVVDRPVLDEDGRTLYVIGSGLTHVALDAETGEEKWTITASGKGSYRQIEKYRDGKYLIVTDMSEYDPPQPPPEYTRLDMLRAYRGAECVWGMAFPRGAELQVLNGRMYAVGDEAGWAGIEVLSVPASWER